MTGTWVELQIAVAEVVSDGGIARPIYLDYQVCSGIYKEFIYFLLCFVPLVLCLRCVVFIGN